MEIQKVVGVTTKTVKDGFYKDCIELQIHAIDIPEQEKTEEIRLLERNNQCFINSVVEDLYNHLNHSFLEEFLKKMKTK